MAIFGPNSPPCQHSATWTGPPSRPMGLWFLQWEKENLWWTSSFLGILGAFPRGPLKSLLTVITGEIFGAQSLKNRQETEKGVRAHGNQCSNLGRSHSCLQQHSGRDPSQQLCQSAEPSQWPHLASRLGWHRLAVQPNLELQLTDHTTHQGHSIALPRQGSKFTVKLNC